MVASNDSMKSEPNLFNVGKKIRFLCFGNEFKSKVLKVLT